ncbi:hypothetical protein QJS10_CPA06g02182 [Acorus calamus]|uniref:HTH TFE/IIEalpha-type domain-containing protein n=1 Tax=Acorus calamus TaxID=4465 RepID=A0AAV9EKQ1_ACOCL|nr:hypothetical protein QJS10_CPA06g02182 [Acorus calamus]
MSLEPYRRLVKLVARAFYDDLLLKGENQTKTGRGDNRGMAVVVLDALTKREWVREEDLAKVLKLHSKQLRRTLRHFEEEKLVSRDHRRESAKGGKTYNAAISAAGDGQQVVKEGEEKTKMHTHSYCCLDYSQIYDVVRYRMHRMKKKLKDELDNRNTIQEYICPNCERRYSAFDALRLISMKDDSFHCEKCDGELVAESDKLAAEEMGDADDNARRRRREKLKDMLQKIEVQLKPLMDQLSRVKDLPAPEFGSLQAWEAANVKAGRASNGDSDVGDSSKTSQGQGYGGTPMPFLGETKVEVALSGVEVKEEDSKPSANTSLKVIPPWMIKQGMKLTEEQRGEAKHESMMDNSLELTGPIDDKKPEVDDDEKNIQDAFVKAYYTALAERQREQEAATREMQNEDGHNMMPSVISNGVSAAPSDRRVGMKSKREDDGDDDIEWEEALPSGSTVGTTKLHDLNVQAEESGEDEDEIDWEEG